MRSGLVRILPRRIDGIDAVEAQTCHAFPPHSHEQYGIGLIHDGAQKSLSGRGVVEAGAGDIITVNPGEVHDGIPIAGQARAWRMLYFEPEFVRGLAADISEGAAPSYELTLPVLPGGELAPSFRRLFERVAGSRPDDSGLVMDELLLSLFARIGHERACRDAPRAGATAVRRAVGVIDDEPAAAVSLADLARHSGLSRFQVLRGFVRETGLTPHAYLMQRRTDLARRLIARGSGLADAALTSGFSDQSHMTRTFTRIYGISPGAYAAAVR